MRTVWFANKEPIDLAAISIMGVSVKASSNPIGFFGTGLKFALATLLRTGHEVDLTVVRSEVESSFIQFKAVPVTIRGEEFRQVRMVFNGGEAWQDLGFTTALGRNWEPWMAYRELRSNTMDEDGVVLSDYGALAGSEHTWGTVFEVRGEPLAACHADAHNIFISSSPIYSNPECDVHAGRSSHVFYRGVRAFDLPMSSMFRYNVRSSCTLTEDRTLKGEWELKFHVARALALCEDEEVLEAVLLAQRGSFESTLDYVANTADARPSTKFLEMVARLRNNAHLNLSAIKLWTKHADIKAQYTQAKLDAYEENQISVALQLVRRLMPDAQRSDFIVLDGMGEGILGMHRLGLCYVSRRALEKGARHLASTIYEELLHKHERLSDESRDLQDFLFDKLFMTVERLEAVSPLPPPPSPEERQAAADREAARALSMEPSTYTSAELVRRLGLDQAKDDDDNIPF